MLTLEIADQGRGLPPGTANAGVGIAAMRERMRLLKGQLEIKTGRGGTSILATLPLAAAPGSSSGAVA
jgi:signal transduction histidine kinase